MVQLWREPAWIFALRRFAKCSNIAPSSYGQFSEESSAFILPLAMQGMVSRGGMGELDCCQTWNKSAFPQRLINRNMKRPTTLEPFRQALNNISDCGSDSACRFETGQGPANARLDAIEPPAGNLPCVSRVLFLLHLIAKMAGAARRFPGTSLGGCGITPIRTGRPGPWRRACSKPGSQTKRSSQALLLARRRRTQVQ